MANVKHFTKQELIENLQLITKEIGRPPTRPEYDNHVDAIASFNTIVAYFGSYYQALEEANLSRKNFPPFKRVRVK